MLTVVITIIVIGLLLWVVNTYVPMEARIKQILNFVVIICVILWLLNVFGVFSYLGAGPVPRLHH